MLERNVLQDRVDMLGPVRHEEVRDVLVLDYMPLLRAPGDLPKNDRLQYRQYRSVLRAALCLNEEA